MTDSPELGGLAAGGFIGFSPADFQDADDLRPIAAVFDIGGHGQVAPYSVALKNMLDKHMEEIRSNEDAVLNLPSKWKKRLRDFLSQKNNDLLDFLKLSVPSHPVLGPGEVLLRRFGNPQVTPTHASVREFCLDASGEDVAGEISAALESMRTGQGPLQDHAAQTRYIYEQYRDAGEAVLRAQVALKCNLDKLDRVQGRLSQLFEIDPSAAWPPLMEATEAYLANLYKESAIEEQYKLLIAAYRRFAVLRGIVETSRSIISQESEPVCTICLQESITHALVPCGHTFCQTCMRRQGTSCYMCRSNIKDRVKLYFG